MGNWGVIQIAPGDFVAIKGHPCTKSRSYDRLRRLMAARRPIVDSFSPG